jgi:hypothetical protein
MKNWKKNIIQQFILMKTLSGLNVIKLFFFVTDAATK